MKLFKKFNKKGFTLFELLAVMAILAIIAGIAVPRVMETINNSRIDSICSSMEMMANAARRMVIEAQIRGTDFGSGTTSITSENYTADQFFTLSFSDYVEGMDTSIDIDIAENGETITIIYDGTYQGVDVTEVSGKSSSDAIEDGADAYAGKAVISITP